jgi:hypothetical protein
MVRGDQPNVNLLQTPIEDETEFVYLDLDSLKIFKILDSHIHKSRSSILTNGLNKYINLCVTKVINFSFQYVESICLVNINSCICLSH